MLLPREVKTLVWVTWLVGRSAKTLLPGPQPLALTLPFLLPPQVEVLSSVSASRKSGSRPAAMGTLTDSRPSSHFVNKHVETGAGTSLEQTSQRSAPWAPS